MSLKSGKSPGPDGFIPEFYKECMDMIIDQLHNMFIHSSESGCLPSSLNQADISLIKKKKNDRPYLDCFSFYPVSLINVNAKILSKILAKGLEVTAL